MNSKFLFIIATINGSILPRFKFIFPYFLGGKGKKICILGAAGGVGSLAVQIAKAENAEVTATCSKSAMELVRSLGADHIIDYTVENADEQFRGLTFDIILDSAGLGPDYATKPPWGFSKYVTLVPPLLNNTDHNGLIVGTVQSGFSFLHENIRSLWSKCGTTKWGIFEANRKGIEYLKDIADRGLLKPVIDSTFQFNEMDKAYKKMAGGHLRGKIMVQIK